MSQGRHSEAAFATVIEARLLSKGYVPICREGFDRARATALLKKHRASRIAATVTGQLDVGEFAA